MQLPNFPGGPRLYERFCQLAALLNLPSQKDVSIRQCLDDMKVRMETKAVRLYNALPGITIETSLDAISRACVLVNWKCTEETFELIETQQDLEEQAWQLMDLAIACYEPTPDEMPLAVIPRVMVRFFADRLCEALALDAPHAYQLTAELFDAESWRALAGPKPFVPIAESSYTYSTQVIGSNEYAWLEPSDAARQHDDEFEAVTLTRPHYALANLAHNETVDRPSLLCAASTVVMCRLEEANYEAVDSKGRATLEALDAIYPANCRLPLAPGSKTHLFYIRLRTALYAAYLHSGNMDLAYAEREILVARGREYRAECEKLLREWAPPNSKAHERTTLRII
jgi:hypothetical protein